MLEINSTSQKPTTTDYFDHLSAKEAIERLIANPDDAAAPAAKKTTRKGGYKPVTPEVWKGLVQYLEAAKRHRAHPAAYPRPDASALCQPHGPFRHIEEGLDRETGEMGILLSVQNPDRGPRWVPYEVALFLHPILAFGGGFSINADGPREWTYCRLFGGNSRHQLGRLLKDARKGQIVKQVNEEGERIDHHVQAPDYFTSVGAASVQAEGKLTGTPYKGRATVVEVACGYFRRNQPRSGINITEAQYRAILTDAFALYDAVHRKPVTE